MTGGSGGSASGKRLMSCVGPSSTLLEPFAVICIVSNSISTSSSTAWAAMLVGGNMNLVTELFDCRFDCEKD